MNLFKRVQKRLEIHGAFRRTVRELESLSNRDLLDLGIDRSQIRSIARDHAAGL